MELNDCGYVELRLEIVVRDLKLGMWSYWAKEGPEESLDFYDDDLDVSQMASREVQGERHDNHDTGCDEKRKRRHEISFGSRFLRQMREVMRKGMREIKDTVRGVIDTIRPAHRRT
ncbi:hypothetical protein Drorol1_Dr00020583 [Drosera rotundifolia]